MDGQRRVTDRSGWASASGRDRSRSMSVIFDRHTMIEILSKMSCARSHDHSDLADVCRQSSSLRSRPMAIRPSRHPPDPGRRAPRQSRSNRRPPGHLVATLRPGVASPGAARRRGRRTRCVAFIDKNGIEHFEVVYGGLLANVYRRGQLAARRAGSPTSSVTRGQAVDRRPRLRAARPAGGRREPWAAHPGDRRTG